MSMLCNKSQKKTQENRSFPGKRITFLSLAELRCATGGFETVLDPMTGRLRVLTPIECERLNGFPDNWTDTGMPERMRYFCMGNALVVPLVKRIGGALLSSGI